MMNKFRLFYKLNNNQKRLYFKAYFLSGKYRFLILKIPFSKLAEKMGALNQENREIAPLELQHTMSEIRNAVINVCKNTSWESKCLVQALVAQELFNTYNIPHTLYLGLAKKEDGSTRAHAWLRSGKRIITGGESTEQYAVIATFGSKQYHV